MTQRIVPTHVEHTSAAHLSLSKRSTHTSDDMTVVWSTLTHTCDGCTSRPHSVAANEVPEPWDSSGLGDWAARTRVQCGDCGTSYGPYHQLVEGHVSGDELTALAGEVAEQDRWNGGQVAVDV